MQILKSCLRFVCVAEKREEINITLAHETGPMQKNGDECGVFIIENGRSFRVDEKTLSTSSNSFQIVHVQRIIKFELLKGEL